ncbi:MAG: WG repeat-containing protein, partial [Saprospiraceae bacterium]
LAEESRKKAISAQKKAERLSSHFHFGDENAAWAYRNGRFAVIDRDGNRLTDYIYSTPDTFANGITLTNVNGQFVFLDYKGKEITKRYDFVAQQSNDIYFAGSGKSDFQGFPETDYICLCQAKSANSTNNKMVELNVYPYFLKLNEHLLLAPTKDGSWTRLNENGCQTGHTPYKAVSKDNFSSYKSGLIAVKIDSLWGFIDSLENWVIHPQFVEIPFWGRDIEKHKKDSLIGIIDSLINLVTPLKVENVYASNHNHLTPAKRDSLWGYVDDFGDWRIQPQYTEVHPFWNGVAEVSVGNSWKNKKSGIIDTTGKVIIPIKYQNIFSMPENGKAWVTDENYFYFVDSTGQKIDSIFNRGHWIGISDKCWVGGKERDSTILIFSDGQVLHWPPNEGIKGIGRYVDKIDFAIKINGTWHYADSSRIYDSEIHLWDDIYFEQNGVARVRKDTLWGLIDSTGQLIAEPQFRQISNFENGLARIQSGKDTLWGVISTTGQILVEPKFEEVDIEDFEGISISVRKGKLWGYNNITRQIYIEPKFNKITIVNDEGALAFVRKDTLWGRIDTAGHIVMDDIGGGPTPGELDDWTIDTPIEVEYIAPQPAPFGNKLTRFLEGELWGIRDSTGQVILKPQFKSISYFNHGLAEVQRDSLLGYINSLGRLVLEPQFNETFGFVHGLAPVRKDSLWGYIDTSGKVVVEPQFNETYAFRCGLAPVQKGKLQGYIDTTGHLFVPPQFDFVYSFKNNIAWVKKDTLWGILDVSGHFLIEPQYSKIIKFANGLVAIKKDSLWGFVDNLGHILIKPIFDEVEDYEESWSSAEIIGFTYGPGKDFNLYVNSDNKVGIQSALIPVRKGSQLGLVDKTGQVVLPIQFSIINAFENGFAKVEQSEKKGLIDIHFNLVVPCEYTDLRRVSANNYMTEINGRYGLFNPKYGIHIPAEYESFGFGGEEFDLVRAKKNGKWGWVDQRGAVKIPFRYDASMPFKNGRAWVLQEPKEEFFEINQEGKMIQE